MEKKKTPQTNNHLLNMWFLLHVVVALLVFPKAKLK